MALAPACKSSDPAEAARADDDGDGTANGQEDRDQDGVVDPGETNPAVADTDGDGIDDPLEVSTAACAVPNDRPFEVYDVPGADSMLLVDARVSERTMLRTMDNRAPGAAFVDPSLHVAAVLVAKRAEAGIGTPEAARDLEQRRVIATLGAIASQRTRTFQTVQGFAAEQAIFTLHLARESDARDLAALVAGGIMNGVTLTGLPAPAGPKGAVATVSMLTIHRGARVVYMTAVAVGDPPSGDQLIRVDELTDGTNVARHGSFTRHVCDAFTAKEQSKLDIIWIVDDSGSMEDDQMAVGAAASAMADVLTSANVDFRLGVARTMATDQITGARGRLEGGGLTADLREFQRTIVVGAEGGWEPGLETGILALDRLMPATTSGDTPDPRRLREDAKAVVIHMSDERDQEVECAACGGCDGAEGEQRFCDGAGGQAVIDRYVAAYTTRNAVTFAIVGDLPTGCQQTATRDDFEPGQGYVEVANATGGHFGSLCGDMRQNVEDVARAATGIASEYDLSALPASATIRVAKGLPGMGVAIPRSRTNGFDYDATRNRIVFYGDARPKKDEEIVIGYRRWDWKGNTDRPGDPDQPNPSPPPPGTPPTEGCDLCEEGTSCDPELDTVLCVPVCGDVVCEGGYVCLPDTATCGDPSDLPPVDACGGTCDPGLVCDPRDGGACVVPCEQTGCDAGQVCSMISHLCQVPNL
ncbi:hypothetical protein L6R52_17550 [Myxococcota bacterium]|nr:hypothetical protein [Myxococcota bacterium]